MASRKKTATRLRKKTKTATSKAMWTYDFFMEMKPRAAARTRCTCRGKFPSVYTEPKYREWLTEAVKILKGMDPLLPPEVRAWPVRINIEVAIKKAKTSKLVQPLGDNDNYEKGVWDAMTKADAFWLDDKQIVENQTTKRWAKENESEGYYVHVEFIDPDSYQAD